MISIVITACGAKPITEACLESLKWNTEIAYELVFVDATPAQYFAPYTVEEIAKALHRADRPAPPINLVTLPNVVTAGEPSVKLATMWNTGTEAAKYDEIVSIPDDVIVGWRAIDQLALALKLALCVYTLHSDGRMPPSFKSRAKALGSGEPRLTVTGEHGFHGNGFAFTREAWKRFGPFDTQFQWACIDDDWAETLRWGGCAPRECCTALLHHGIAGSVAGHMASVPGFTAWIQRVDGDDRRRLMKKWHMGQRPVRR